METLVIAQPGPTLEAAVDADASLAQRACAGDASALEQLLARHEPAVRRCAARLLARDDVDDVVQDVFVTVLERVGQFRGGSAWSTWLTSITLNRCRSRLRRERLRRRWLGWLVGATRTESSRTSNDDRLNRALGALRSSDRELLVLRYYEEQSVREISEALGAAPGAVEVRLTRARARLKQILERDAAKP